MPSPADIAERKGPTMHGIESRCYFWHEPRLFKWYIEVHVGSELIQTVTMDRPPTDDELNCMMHMLLTHAVWKEHNDNHPD